MIFLLLLFAGFFCYCTVGITWHAVATPLYFVMARKSLLFWNYLASPWSYQVQSILLVSYLYYIVDGLNHWETIGIIVARLTYLSLSADICTCKTVWEWHTFANISTYSKFYLNIFWWIRYGTLTFQAPDTKKFPSVNLCYAAGRAGGTMTGVLSAANEIAVELFVAEK